MGAALVACGGGSDPRAEVAIAESRFGPKELVVEAGTTVEFRNLDPFEHTVTSRADAGFDFDSGELEQDVAFTLQFDSAGTFAYFCQIHPTMRATVVVQ